LTASRGASSRFATTAPETSRARLHEAELHAIAAELAAVEALGSSEQRFRLAFENNMAGMILVDVEDRVLAVNDTFCEMSDAAGGDRRQGSGTVHPSKKVHGRLAPDETAWVYVDRYVHKDGGCRCRVSKSTARNAAGTTLYFVISVRTSPRSGLSVPNCPISTARLAHRARQPCPLRGPALPDER